MEKNKKADYSEEVWRLIFFRCDYSTLSQINETCKLFKKITDSSSFWVRKALYDDVDQHLPPLEWRRFVKNQSEHAFDYRKIYKKKPFNRNLLPQMRADSTWTELEANPYVMYENEGDGFRLEVRPKCCVTDPRVPICLATSFGECRRFFEISFEEFGIENWVMDEIRPKISVSDIFSSRGDCGAFYILQAQLLKEGEFFERTRNEKKTTRFFEKVWNPQQGGAEWRLETLKFENYPVGVRRIGILTCGGDRAVWAGHYGAKMGNASLVITFPEEIRFKERNEFYEVRQGESQAIFLNGRSNFLSLRLPRQNDSYRYRPDSP